MATHEHNPLMSYKDENGDIHKIYPKTKAGNVDGLYNSPAMTGVPTAPTAEAGTNTEQIATTAFVHNAVENVTVPTTDTITEGSTEALTSGGMYQYFNPSGASFGMDSKVLMVTGREIMLRHNDIGSISLLKRESNGLILSCSTGVQMSATGTYDSSVTSGYYRTDVDTSRGGFSIYSEGSNSSIPDAGVQFGHIWSHDDVYAPVWIPSMGDTVNLGASYAPWKMLYLNNSPSVTSDRNQKKDITYPTAEDADKIISKLKPCTYRFVNGTSGRIHNGLIAQDVEEALNDLGIDTRNFAAFIKSQKAEIDEDGNPKPIEGEYNYSLRYEEFISLLISECQYLKSRIDDLESRLPVTE